MNKVKLFSRLTLIVLAGFLIISGCKKHDKEHWSYEGDGGPAHWGELKEEFATCKTGGMQSPVNIPSNSESSEDGPVISYSTKPFSVIDNGHTVQANLEEGNTITLEGKKYSMKQIHFHSPSENQLNGKSFPLEGHIVHKAEDGSLAVVGIFFDSAADAKENPVLNKIWAHVPAEKEKDHKVEGEMLDLTMIFPEERSMFRFDGSLTTPPCSEGVKWNVFEGVTKIPAQQIEAFKKHYSNNARPVQDLHGRKILRVAAETK